MWTILALWFFFSFVVGRSGSPGGSGDGDQSDFGGAARRSGDDFSDVGSSGGRVVDGDGVAASGLGLDGGFAGGDGDDGGVAVGSGDNDALFFF